MKSILSLLAAFVAAIGIAQAAPVNKDCPVSGKASGSASCDYSKTVSFCCDKCKAKFDANPNSFVAKVSAYDTKSPKCPVSGKAVDAKITSDYKVTVGVCCNKCKAKFDADPDKYVAKAVK